MQFLSLINKKSRFVPGFCVLDSIVLPTDNWANKNDHLGIKMDKEIPIKEEIIFIYQ